ncbi:MAG TPA: tRNA-intron lyase [Patescibacteria group bacterium]|nr:tRNA-intron lyase [Patescibacteria group bacterium]
MSGKIADVELLADSRLIVWNPAEAQTLYSSRYYGKPLGVAKPKEGFDTPLVLDPIEGVYLLERGVIDVVQGEDAAKVTPERLKALARGILEGFDDHYTVYSSLRDKGFVVTPGIKYGCDFAVYEHGPGIDHAPYIVQVKGKGDGLSATEIVKAGRLATTVRKTFMIALVDGEEISFLSFKWWRP